MTWRSLLVIAAASASAAAALAPAACATPAERPAREQALELTIGGGPETGCRVEVRGRSMTPEEFEAWSLPLAAGGGPEVYLLGRGDTPYRCVVAVLDSLHRAGITSIGFISEPAR